LTDNKKGRASIAPLAFLRNGCKDHKAEGEHLTETASADSAHSANWQDALAGSTCELNGEPLAAIAVVHGDGSVRPLLERLLGMTRIVRNLEAATAAWQDSKGAFHYVTLAGELLSRHGVYTGG